MSNVRNHYSKEFEFIIREKAKTCTTNQLLAFAHKYGYKMTKDTLGNFLYRRGIRATDYSENHVRIRKDARPIGYEYTKPDGMVMVKVGNPTKYEYKQRLIYKEYYGEIPKGHMIIFLDGDRTNYDINNLKAVSTPEYLCARNKGLISNDKETTKTGFMVVDLLNKTKEALYVLEGKEEV